MAIAVQELTTGQVPGETPNVCTYPYWVVFRNNVVRDGCFLQQTVSAW